MKSFISAFLLLVATHSFSQQLGCTNYTVSNSDLPSNQIYSISSLPTDSTSYNDIWLGTEAGLVHYSNGAFVTYTTADGLPDNSIRKVYVAPDSTVWAGCFTGGLASFKNGVVTTYNTQNSALPDNFVKAIVYEAPGKLWVGTTSGFCKLENDTFTNYDLSTQGIESNHVAAIALRTDGIKVIGFVNGGFAYYNDTIFDFYTHTNSNLPDNTVLSIALDPDNNPYMAQPSGGLTAHFGGNIWQIYNEGLFPDMPTNSFRCIAADPWGFWAGSVDKGVFRKMNTGHFLDQSTFDWATQTIPADYIQSAWIPPASFKNQYLFGWFGGNNTGLFSVNNVTPVNESAIDNTVMIMRNAEGQVMVKANNKLLQVNAYSIDGKLLADAKPNDTSTLFNLQNSNGIVVIRTVTEKGISVRKIVVN